MKRIFISHSQSDVDIADSLFDFLIYALKIDEQDILCTSDPESGLTFGSDTISNQLHEIVYHSKLDEVENNYPKKKQELEQKEYSLQQLQQLNNHELEKIEHNYRHQKNN